MPCRPSSRACAALTANGLLAEHVLAGPQRGDRHLVVAACGATRCRPCRRRDRRTDRRRTRGRAGSRTVAANSSAESWAREPTATTSATFGPSSSVCKRLGHARRDRCRSRRCPSESAGLSWCGRSWRERNRPCIVRRRRQHEVEVSVRHHRAEVVVLGARPSRRPVRADTTHPPARAVVEDARRSACRAARADRGGRGVRAERCTRPPAGRPVCTVQCSGSRRSGTMSVSQSSASQSNGRHSARPVVRSACSTSRWRRQSMTWLARSIGVRSSHRCCRPSGIEVVALDHRHHRRLLSGRVEHPRDATRRAWTFRTRCVRRGPRSTASCGRGARSSIRSISWRASPHPFITAPRR